MKVRIKAGLHGLVIDGVKKTYAPGDVVDLTVAQYERIGSHRAEIVYKEDPPAKAVAAPKAAVDEPEEEVSDGRWAEILKLKANRLKEAIDGMTAIADIESLISEEEEGKDRYGIKVHAQRRIEELKGGEG